MTSAQEAADKRRAISRLEELATVALQDGHHDESEVLEELEFQRSRFAILDDDDIKLVARRLGERLNIDVDRGTKITADDYAPWLETRKREYDWDRWKAYRTLLLQQKRPPKVIDKLDDLTDEILDLVGDPAVPGSWARRGLVLGDVQSGKTGTYLGLFNKAADVGYRLVILLAGNTEVLRQQTQARVDEAFIGRDSSRQVARKGTDVTQSRLVGVGTIRKDLAHTTGMTTVLRDFRKSSYEATNITIPTDAAHPYVFVLKKNKSVLTAVIKWLEEQSAASGGAINVPVLVLDDESDYASINTKDETDPTAINKAIRDILALFTRSSYVAFTATPFANIFVDHGVENDLFPKDFVYSLEAPSNYVGSARTFGTSEAASTSGLELLDDVEDLIPLSHKSQLHVPRLPPSMLEAVRTYFLANAIRDLRGQVDQPRSMLVNVSRFKHVQGQVFDLLESEVSAMNNAVQLHGADPAAAHSEIAKIRECFSNQYGDCEFTWEEVAAVLPSSVSDIRVLLFNSDKDRKLAQQEDLAWDRPPRMIAVGGDVLSRGLTLEGLCVSYFNRSVTASDTLMQMARWFGYRDGYQDICRLWINERSADNYRRAAESVEDLRVDLRLMLRQQLTPADFGLAVKRHPDALLITARNKMRNAQSVSRVISLAGRSLETTQLNINKVTAAPARNRRATDDFLEKVAFKGEYSATRRGWHRWRGIDRVEIATFLEAYTAAPSDPFFSGSALSGWIRRAKAKQFATWDVVIARGQADARTIELGGQEVRVPKRHLDPDGDVARVSGQRLRLAGSTDIEGLLDKTVADKISEEFLKEFPEKKSTRETVFYKALERPTLLIYPLSGEQVQEDYLVALKVAIPGDSTDVNNHDGEVEYVINTVAQEQWLTEFAGADDEDVDD